MRKLYIIAVMATAFLFASSFCLAEEHPAKPAPKPAPAAKPPAPAQQPKPQQPGIKPVQQPVGPQQHQPGVKPQQPVGPQVPGKVEPMKPQQPGIKPVQRPEGPQVQGKPEPVRPQPPQMRPQPPRSPAGPGPQVRPGERPPRVIGNTHPVDRAVLHEQMRAPIRREDARLAAERYRHEERTRFVRHVEPLRFRPENRAMLHMIRIVPGTYYYRRNMFYDTYAWGPPPYVYNLAPRYGLFDAVFLAFMVDHVAEREYALMYYNHQNDEAFVQWRQQMDQMAADNAELRAKLATMDQQVVQLQSQGTPQDPNYVPESAQDVALSSDVIDQLTQPQPQQ